jgi:hypothetical protein
MVIRNCSTIFCSFLINTFYISLSLTLTTLVEQFLRGNSMTEGLLMILMDSTRPTGEEMGLIIEIKDIDKEGMTVP